VRLLGTGDIGEHGQLPGVIHHQVGVARQFLFLAHEGQIGGFVNRNRRHDGGSMGHAEAGHAGYEQRCGKQAGEFEFRCDHVRFPFIT